MDLYAARSYATPVSNSTLLPLLLLSLATQKIAPKTSKSFKPEYDYIVVGGGTAGSVVSSRLSEVPCVNILVLEAGPEPPLLSEVPGLATYFPRTHLDWKFQTVPQRHGLTGRRNRQTNFPSGKVLGGSSIINYMFYVRGNRKNYDDWEEQGAKGWSYKDVLPYFLKLEDNRNANYLANGYHFIGGPITVEKPRYQPELKLSGFNAAKSLGYQFVDSNARRQTGFFDQQANLRNNQRCSVVKGYLVPAENRENLDILVNTMVTKIIIENGRAIGVQFISRGQTFKVRAKREVIVSAGSINTPKLLMLSGIGPREELQKFGIPVIADIPVGKNLHDHGGVNLLFTMNPRFRSYEEKLSDPSSILQFINTRSGPLAGLVGSLFTAFIDGLNTFPAKDFPTAQIYLQESQKPFDHLLGLKPEVLRQYIGPYQGKPLRSCMVSLTQPKSRGTVTLKSRNPFDPPLVDPNYLEEPEDLDNYVDGLKVCKKLFNTPQMRELDAKFLETLVPGCEMYVSSDDEYFKCFTRSLLGATSHMVGTSKMGNPNDNSTVVDPKLRVKNVQGLRVVDASVMPIVPSGNTHVPTLMIAEKASDMIKESIRCPFVYFFG